MESQTNVNAINLGRPDSATRLKHGGCRAVDKHKPRQKQPIVDKINHEHLEQEYLDLRRKLALPDNENNDAKAVRVMNKAQREVLSDTMLSLTPKDYFESDVLGINHFKQHLVNVKATSKRSKRQNVGLSEHNYRQGRRNSLKFKPLYEKHHLDENELLHNPNKMD